MDGSVGPACKSWKRFIGGLSRLVVLALAIICGSCKLMMADEMVPAPTATPTSDSVPPAPGDVDTPSTNSGDDKPSAPAALSLDELLDLADKDPQKLQSIRVNAHANDSLRTPESVFTPDKSAGTAANSTGELLSRAFGVVTRTTSVLNQDARLRGYSGSQIVGISDGMNQGKARLDVDSLFSQIDPNAVESITVIPGPYAVEYGPGFAFFNAQLLAPKRTEQLTSTSNTKASYNSNGQQMMWRETYGFSDRNSGAIVSFGQRLGNDYRAGAHSSDFLVPASFHEQDIFAAISSDINDRNRVDFSYLHQAIENTEIPGVAYDINNQQADQINGRWTWRDDFTGKDRLQIQGWWNQVMYQGDSSRSSKQQTFYADMIGDPFPIIDGGQVVANGFSENCGARANVFWGDTESWQAKSGIDWRRVDQFHRETVLLADGTNPLGNGVLGIPDSSANDFGIFASGGTTLTDRWDMALGQRIDAVTYGVNQFDVVGATTAFTPNNQSVTGFATPIRMLNMTYLTSTFRISDEWTMKAGTAYAMRPPNLTELYSNSPSAPLVRFGNSLAYGDSELAAEKNLQFDLGFTQRLEKSTFSVRAFHSEIHDYIGLGATNYGNFPEVGTTPNGILGRTQPFMANPHASVPNPNYSSDQSSFTYVYRNIDHVTMQGFEMQGEQRPEPWLEFVESLNYTRATNDDPTWTDLYTGLVHHLGGSEGLPGIYPLNATATVRLVEPTSRKWIAEWQSRFVYEQNYLATSLGEIGTPGFVVHNINTSYRWSDHVSLRMSVLNVFNLNYYEHNSLAIMDKNGNVTFVKDPGISLFTSIECRF